MSPRCVTAPSTASEKVVACASAHRSTARSTFTNPMSRRIIQTNTPTSAPATTMPRRATVSASPVAVAGSIRERRKRPDAPTAPEALSDLGGAERRIGLGPVPDEEEPADTGRGRHRDQGHDWHHGWSSCPYRVVGGFPEAVRWETPPDGRDPVRDGARATAASPRPPFADASSARRRRRGGRVRLLRHDGGPRQHRPDPDEAAPGGSGRTMGRRGRPVVLPVSERRR